MPSASQEPAPHGHPNGREDAVLDRIGDLLATASFRAPKGQIWFGDDAATLGPTPEGFDLVVCSDLGVAGVHADLNLLSPQDLGWRTMTASLSDLAAMGALPWRAVVSVCATPSEGADALMEGAIEVARLCGSPVVGGDVSASSVAVVDVAALGLVPSGNAMRRDCLQPGETLFVTGALGASAAGLRLLRAGHDSTDDDAAQQWHRRPLPRLRQGAVLRECGVRAAMDVSDGLSLDLHRMATLSSVGFVLNEIPVSPSARLEEALGGGEDYELLFSTGEPERVLERFHKEGFTSPIKIGVVTKDASERRLGGQDLPVTGWRHEVS